MQGRSSARAFTRSTTATRLIRWPSACCPWSTGSIRPRWHFCSTTGSNGAKTTFTLTESFLINRLCLTTILMMTVACPNVVMAAESAPLPAHEATYEVLRHGKKVGELEVSLEQLDSGVWYYRSDTRATAGGERARTVSSEQAASAPGRGTRIRMLPYHHAQHAPANNRHFQHQADWQAGTTQVRTEKGEKTVELTDRLVDPLSLRLQLAVNLSDPDKRYGNHDFELIDRNEIKHARYMYDGDETLELPAGCFETVRIRRDEKPGSDKVNLSWHAADFHWMPVRILQRRGGKDRLDIRLVSSSLPLKDCSYAFTDLTHPFQPIAGAPADRRANQTGRPPGNAQWPDFCCRPNAAHFPKENGHRLFADARGWRAGLTGPPSDCRPARAGCRVANGNKTSRNREPAHRKTPTRPPPAFSGRPAHRP